MDSPPVAAAAISVTGRASHDHDAGEPDYAFLSADGESMWGLPPGDEGEAAVRDLDAIGEAELPELRRLLLSAAQHVAASTSAPAGFGEARRYLHYTNITALCATPAAPAERDAGMSGPGTANGVPQAADDAAPAAAAAAAAADDAGSPEAREMASVATSVEAAWRAQRAVVSRAARERFSAPRFAAALPPLRHALAAADAARARAARSLLAPHAALAAGALTALLWVAAPDPEDLIRAAANALPVYGAQLEGMHASHACVPLSPRCSLTTVV